VAAVLYEVAFGLLLGFSLTIPPGPMNAFIAAQAVRSFREGLTTGFGALSADLLLGGIVFGLHAEFDLAAAVRWVYLLGAAVMVALGVTIVRGASAHPPPPTSGVRTYSKAFGIGLANPFQIVWWLTAGLAFAYVGGWVLFVALFAAVAVWVVLFPWGVRSGTQQRPGFARAVVVASGAAVFAFAGYFLYLAL